MLRSSSTYELFGGIEVSMLANDGGFYFIIDKMIPKKGYFSVCFSAALWSTYKGMNWSKNNALSNVRPNEYISNCCAS